MARRGFPLALTIALACGALVGCGHGPSAGDWAGTVCAALTPWRGAITELNTKAQAQMSAATTPEQTRTNLIALLDGAEGASERARAAVAAAGTPDVDGGAEVARRFVGALGAARDAYAHARREVEALPTAEPTAFYNGVVATFATLNREYSAGALDTSSLDSVDLRRAFDEVDACR